MSPRTQTTTSTKYEILREVVSSYPGIVGAVEPLMKELQSQRNWHFIVKELRSYCLKNFYLQDHHEKGSEAVRTIIGLFLDAADHPDTTVRQSAVESLLFYLEKIFIDGDSDLQKYHALLRESFARILPMKDERFFLIVTNPHQLKKLRQIILAKMPAEFPVETFNALLIRYFSATFEYWLSQLERARTGARVPTHCRR